MFRSKSWLFAGLSGLALLAAAPAMAQVQATPSAQSTTTLETVVVTAQRRSQDIQKVAGAVSALTAERLSALGVTSLSGLATQTPGLTYADYSGSTFVTLRGVGVPVDTGEAAPNVAIYVDGVYLPRTTEATLSSYDLQRVEVLRGPQGTLYGGNATGGAINFISAKPTNQFAAEVGAGYGNYDTWDLHGFVSGPVTDGLRVRLSASTDNRDKGFVKDVATGGSLDRLHRYTLRGALSVDLTSSLTLDLSAQYQNEKFDIYHALAYAPGSICNCGSYTFYGPGTVVTTKSYQIASDVTPTSERNTLLLNSTLTWDLGNGQTLKSTTGFIDHKFNSYWDADGTSVSFNTIGSPGVPRRQPSQSISEEVDWSGKFGKGGSWVVGAFFEHENFTPSIPAIFPNGVPLGVAAGTTAPGTLFIFNPGANIENDFSQHSTSYALFLDATVPVTDKLRVYGGARISWDGVVSHQKPVVINPAPPSGTIGLAPVGSTPCGENSPTDRLYPPGSPGSTIKQSWNPVNPRVGVQYDLTDHVNTYVQYQRGFKDGGVGPSVCGNSFSPEQLDSTEVGIKSTFWQGKAVLNLAAFHYRYSNLQIFKIVGTQSSVDNAPAMIDGLDVEAHIRPVSYLRVDLAASLLNARVGTFNSVDPELTPPFGAPPAAANLRGNKLPYVPSYNVNLGIESDLPIDLKPFSLLILRGEANWVGDSYARVYNRDTDLVKANVKLNAMAILSSGDWQVRLYAKNLTDKAVFAHLIYGGSLTDSLFADWQPPRTFGFEVTRKY